jgi:L-alanine-DL-glutamate epimerase-like enolase superfamily enzyme
VRLSAHKATIELTETFTISRSSQDSADVVFVELEHDGLTGYGEAAPIERYDQSAESALAYLVGLTDDLGDDPWALEEIEARLPPGEPAARSAIDAALHDLQGKLAE